MEEKDQPIQEYFKGKCILITGATGFLGKVLLEKLVRSCPGIKVIYVLLRPSTDETVQQRFANLVNHRIFNRIKDSTPDLFMKLQPMSGDVTCRNLGLDECNLKVIKTEVQFVFHCAANVRFDDEPKNTLKINLLGVKNVMDLCLTCAKLEAVVHTSTAFCFCHRRYICEHTYAERITPERLLDMLQWMSNDELRAICDSALQGRPSLYPFSKAMAEILICTTYAALPVIIVRPSVVTAALNEPYPGWIDNYNGPSGFIAVCGKGIVRTLLVDPDVSADWVPVDIVANTLIVAAHHIAVHRYRTTAPELRMDSKVPIINCTCPKSNLLTWMEIIKICLPYLIKYPSSQVYRKPGGTATNSIVQYSACKLYAHYLPAFLVDMGLFLMWKKPRVIRIFKSIHKVMGHLEYYTTNSISFDSSNMRRLECAMDPVDKQEFPLEQSTMDWNNYLENYVLGVRRHFLMEEDRTLPTARKTMFRRNLLWIAFKLASVYGILMLMKRLSRHGNTSFHLSTVSYLPVTEFVIEKFHQIRH